MGSTRVAIFASAVYETIGARSEPLSLRQKIEKGVPIGKFVKHFPTNNV